MDLIRVKYDDRTVSSGVKILEVGITNGPLQVFQGLPFLLCHYRCVFHPHNDYPLDSVGGHVALNESDPVQEVLKLDLGLVEHGFKAERDDVNAALPQEKVDAPPIHVASEHAHNVLLV